MKGKVVKMLIVPLALAALLAGCGSQTGSSTTPSNTASNTTSNSTGTETGSGTDKQTGSQTGSQTGTETPGTSDAYGSKGALADNDLTEAEMLKYAIEDEYAAKSEYQAVIAKLGNVAPFSNIVTAEQSHIDALKNLYSVRNMEVPADNSSGMAVVPSTIIEAKSIGVEAETSNIAMYEKFLSQNNLPSDLKQVFTNLKEASEQHLEAFKK